MTIDLKDFPDPVPKPPTLEQEIERAATAHPDLADLFRRITARMAELEQEAEDQYYEMLERDELRDL